MYMTIPVLTLPISHLQLFRRSSEHPMLKILATLWFVMLALY